MKQFTRTRWSRITQTVCAAALLAFTCMALPPADAGAALQGSAGNTIIRNQVTVNYQNSLSVAQTAVLSNVVEVTVTTVIAAPKIGVVTPSPGATGALAATQIYNVEIITNSSGPGAVTLSAADGSPVNMSVSGTVPAIGAGNPVFLGTSTIDPTEAKINVAQNVAILGSITLNIPNDGGVPTDLAVSGGPGGAGVRASMNALAVNDTVYLYDGTNYFGKFLVTAVNAPAVGAGATAANGSITLQNTSGGVVAFTPQYDWMIVEAKTLNVTVTQGAMTGANTTGSWVTTFTGTTSAGTGTNTVTTNASIGVISVFKYVRNVTVPVVGVTAVTPAINGGGVTFYRTGVSGKPTDVLEYLYVINNAGSALVKAVVATDAVPVYTKLRNSSAAYGVDNTGGASGTFAVAYRTGNATDQSLRLDNSSGNNTIAWGKSSGTTAGSTMTFYLGNNSTNGGIPASGGELVVAETAYVVYRVTID